MTTFLDSPDYRHDSAGGLGILLTNLGTPDAPTPQALRKYLAEFLADQRVIETPRYIWLPILYGVILNVRPRKSAHAYQQIWTERGSPLLTITREQADGLGRALTSRCPGPIRIAVGMRYGEPSIRAALEELRSAGSRRLLVLPLYPQYCGATSASTMDAVFDILRTWRWVPELRTIMSYHDDAGYVGALAHSIEAHWAVGGRADKLLFSFHGIPKKYLLAGDPYHCQCQKTARLVSEALGLKPEQWMVTFQSRVGPAEWLQPYTDVMLAELPSRGVRSVDVICPGFSADCLETLEEIAMRGRDTFMEAGGQRLSYIPALNSCDEHIGALADLVVRHTQGWPEADRRLTSTSDANCLRDTLERARRLGASQ